MSKKKLNECTEIRKVWIEKESKWYYAVIDIVHLFSQSPNPGEYLKKLKKYKPDFKENFQKLTQIFVVSTSDGPRYLNCVSEIGFFEILKYLPCKKSKSYINFFLDYEKSKVINENQFFDIFALKYSNFKIEHGIDNKNTEIGIVIDNLVTLIKHADIP